MHPFTIASLSAYAAVVLLAGLLRGRLFAIFSFVFVGVHTLLSTTLAPHVPAPLSWAYCYLQAAVYLHYALLTRPRMRPLAYRLLVSLPASWFVAATLLAMPWAVVSAVGLPPLGLWIPYALAVAGLIESLSAKRELVNIALGVEAPSALARHRSGDEGSARPLRIVQLTDTHLGPFMSEARLHDICARAVAQRPDLILLTGDFLTMESQADPLLLARALAPLSQLDGRVFACRGNHDFEAPEHVARSLAHIGARLLIDELVTVQTEAGPVEILGIDFRFRDREEHLAKLTEQFPRIEGLARVAMLHDPGAFKHMPVGMSDLVLSGHTHGGQLGLLRLGLPHTVVSALGKMPDHGLWARGRDRLYVHRGTCHYGFPLRLGVPAEESVLHVHLPLASASR